MNTLEERFEDLSITGTSLVSLTSRVAYEKPSLREKNVVSAAKWSILTLEVLERFYRYSRPLSPSLSWAVVLAVKNVLRNPIFFNFRNFGTNRDTTKKPQ